MGMALMESAGAVVKVAGASSEAARSPARETEADAKARPCLGHGCMHRTQRHLRHHISNGPPTHCSRRSPSILARHKERTSPIDEDKSGSVQLNVKHLEVASNLVCGRELRAHRVLQLLGFSRAWRGVL